MNLNRENLDSLFTSLNTFYNQGLASVWSGWERFANIVPSTGAMEKYPAMVMTGSMRKWVGPRVIRALDGQFMTVHNDDFEHTEGVKRNDIEDDNLGFYGPLFTDMGVNSGNLWPQLATSALTSPGKWADGKPFYSSDREIGKKSVIDNIIVGELNSANYELGRARMMGFKSASGDPLGLVPDVLIVGATNEKAAKRVIKAALVEENGATVSNVNEDEVDILVDPYIIDNSWYLACTTRGVKPVAVQQRKLGGLIRWDNDHDLCVKDHNRNDYGIHNRGASVGAVPMLVIRGVAA